MGAYLTGMEVNGTSLQGTEASYSPPGMEANGTSLQGKEINGTPLQGMEEQGTSLQGKEVNGTSLQGGRDDDLQGTSLQGTPGEHDQGTSLQSAPGEHEQGTGLQGSPEEEMQGTSLQGAPDGDMQGTSLQGAPEGEMQGTSLQGAPDGEMQGTSLQGAPGQENQGIHLQGAPDGEVQGTRLQGASADERRGTRTQRGGQRAYRGLRDLDGARFALASDPTRKVTLRDGQLVAEGLTATAAFRGVPIVATAPDGREFRVEVIATKLVGRTERIELLVDGRPVCSPDEHGVFVAGSWDETGAHVADPDTVTYACADGVIAKCVDWGYAPWLTDDEVHAACTRLARADYCGDGVPWTMDGTKIDVYDSIGVQSPPRASAMRFEAAWGPDGAVCVARTRYDVRSADDRAIIPSCFATLPRCASLDDAAPLGAVLANRSTPTPIAACGD